MWKKAAFGIALFCYALVLTLILLVVRFPKETFISYAVDTIEGILPGFTIGIGDVVYNYPLSLEIQRVSLANQAEMVDIKIETIMLTFDRKSLGKRIYLQSEIYGGKVAMDVVLHGKLKTVELPSITLSGIRLADIEPLQSRLGRPLEGTLDYSGSFEGKGDNGVLSGNGRIIDFHVNLKRPILQNDAVIFDSVAASTILRNGKLVFSDGVATGPSYGGKFSGQIDFTGQWQEGAITVTGVMVPKAEYVKQNRQVARAVSLLYAKYGSREIPYSIGGSLRDPLFRFGETTPDVFKRAIQ